MRIRLNGEWRETEAATVAQLLETLGLPLGRKGTAVAVNETVAPRHRWPSIPLRENDRVEIIRAAQGG